jgi:hypothetical protein
MPVASGDAARRPPLVYRFHAYFAPRPAFPAAFNNFTAA